MIDLGIDLRRRRQSNPGCVAVEAAIQPRVCGCGGGNPTQSVRLWRRQSNPGCVAVEAAIQPRVCGCGGGNPTQGVWLWRRQSNPGCVAVEAAIQPRVCGCGGGNPTQGVWLWRRQSNPGCVAVEAAIQPRVCGYGGGRCSSRPRRRSVYRDARVLRSACSLVMPGHLSTKTECDYLNGWIKTVTYAKVSTENGEPQRYSWGTQEKKKNGEPQRYSWAMQEKNARSVIFACAVYFLCGNSDGKSVMSIFLNLYCYYGVIIIYAC